MLSNAYFLAKFRFDTVENEPAKNLQKFVKFQECSGAKVYTSCRACKMLSNAYFLAKFRFDTAENEPAKNLQILQNFSRILLILLLGRGAASSLSPQRCSGTLSALTSTRLGSSRPRKPSRARSSARSKRSVHEAPRGGVLPRRWEW